MTATRHIERTPCTRFLYFAAIGGSLLATVLLADESAPEGSRPNIVLIMSDDMGWSDIGCYGGEIDTPHLNRLAAAGVRFSQFYNTGRCCPTRASLLTGLYPHQAGVGHMMDDRDLPGYTGNLNLHTPTIAEALQEAGYRTYMCGKWHVTRHVDPNGPRFNWPVQRGFDRFYGTITGAGSFYDPTTLCRDNTFITPDNDTEYQPDTYYYTDAIADNAISFLKQHQAQAGDQPFFLYVGYTAAHWPMHALEKDIAKYRGRYQSGYGPVRKARLQKLREMQMLDPGWDVTPQVGTWRSVKNKQWESACMDVYAAMIDSMDQSIGRLLNELNRQQVSDETLIFFLQDNGGCAEGMGRTAPREPYADNLQPFSKDDLQPQIWPPMQTRDGRPVRTGPDVMPGPADTYIAYGRNWANVSNTPFREYKHWVHEGGISTPLIVHWPNQIASARANTWVHEPAHLIDIMATCLAAAGASLPSEWNDQETVPLEGANLLPLCTGRDFDRGKPLFWEHEGNRAVRDGRWKLVAKGPQGPWELYDMEADRTEMHDLASAHPEIVGAMSNAWNAWANRALVLPWPWSSASE